MYGLVRARDHPCVHQLPRSSHAPPSPPLHALIPDGGRASSWGVCLSLHPLTQGGGARGVCLLKGAGGLLAKNQAVSATG